MDKLADNPVNTPGLLGTLLTVTLIALDVAGEPDKQVAILEPITTVIVALLDSVEVV